MWHSFSGKQDIILWEMGYHPLVNIGHFSFMKTGLYTLVKETLSSGKRDIILWPKRHNTLGKETLPIGRRDTYPLVYGTWYSGKRDE